MLGSTALRGLCASFAVLHARSSCCAHDKLDAQRLHNALAQATEAELPALLRLAAWLPTKPTDY